MALEFQCPSCSKLLRTPDEAAGKKAKCPQCGAIVDVPHESSPQPDDRENEVPSDEIERDPFAESASPVPNEVSANEVPTSDFPTSEVPADDGPLNPYAAPTTISTVPQKEVPRGDLTHTRVAFDDVLSKSWTFFTENLGEMAILGAILFATTIALQILSQAGSVAAEFSGEPVLIGVAAVGTSLIDMAVQIYVGLGAACYVLKVARTGRANVSDIFSAGPFFLRGFAVGVLIGVACLLIMGVCLAPGLATIPAEEPPLTVTVMVCGGLLGGTLCFILWLRYMLSFFFIIDFDAGPMEAMRQSAHYMRGNKLSMFLLMLVVGVVGGLFICLTCCVGNILYLPYYNAMLALFYLSVTGQPLTARVDHDG